MNKVVYKYPIHLATEGRVKNVALPKDAIIRKLDAQGDPTVLYLWCEHELPAQNDIPHRFIVRGTGHDFEPIDGEEFVGSVLVAPFVWHVYELPA